MFWFIFFISLAKIDVRGSNKLPVPCLFSENEWS